MMRRCKKASRDSQDKMLSCSITLSIPSIKSIRSMCRGALALLAVAAVPALSATAVSPEDMAALAEARYNDLRLSSYVTVNDTLELANDPEARERALELLRGLGISKVYVETYRGGHLPEEEELRAVHDFLRDAGFDVAAGVATVPGGDFGVAANAGLTWFNFQSEKTQRDLEHMIRRTARVFDEIIIDDFMCSGDLSAESAAARQGRSWSQYRRDLLTAVSQKSLIGPAREERPDVHMIIKYPQWYDLFHIYGYDVERTHQLYDEVFVGTETRSARRQRFGFTQPYEGFINYRWFRDLAGDRVTGAWFDHGDTDPEDFLDQAYQTVLAGAREIVIFSFAALKSGHGGHQLLRDHFSQLADLAVLVAENPVQGVAGYKPPHSDAGTDVYIMDQIGMFGVPLVPRGSFPQEAGAIFLPTQAAADPNIEAHFVQAVRAGSRIVVTAGFLGATAPDLAALAGIAAPVKIAPLRTPQILVSGEVEELPQELGLASDLQAMGAEVLLSAWRNDRPIPYLTRVEVGQAEIFVLNCETFSQADFDAVGEYLLSPRALGMLEVPQAWADAIRQAFGGPGPVMEAPVRVTLQPLGEAGWLVQNYNLEPVTVRLDFGADTTSQTLRAWPDEEISLQDGVLVREMPARSQLVLTR